MMLERRRDPQRRASRAEQHRRAGKGVIAEDRLRPIIEQRLGHASDLLGQKEVTDVVEKRRRRRVNAHAVWVAGVERHHGGHGRDIRGVGRLVLDAPRPRALLDHPRTRHARDHELVRDRKHTELVDGPVVRQRPSHTDERILHGRHHVRGARSGACRVVARAHHETQEDVHQIGLRLLADAPGCVGRQGKRAAETLALCRGHTALEDEALDLVTSHRIREDVQLGAQIRERSLAYDELAIDERDDEIRDALEHARERIRRVLVRLSDRGMPFGVVRAHRDHVSEEVQDINDAAPLRPVRCALLGHEPAPAARSHALRTRHADDFRPSAKYPGARGAGDSLSATATTSRSDPVSRRPRG